MSFDIGNIMYFGNRIIMRGMNLQWIDKQLSERGWPRRKLVEAVPTLSESMISKVMSGERKLSADEADAIRRFFGYRLPDDPENELSDRIHNQLAKIDDAQLHAVVLYLEALAGNAPSQKPA